MGRFFGKFEEALMAGLLGFMTLITFAQVVLRYGFNSGFVWALEATTYAFGWLVLIGMAYGVRTNTHLAVDLAMAQLSPRLRKAMALVAVGLCLLYAVLMGYGAFHLIDRLIALGNNARDIPVPRWLLMIITPIAFTLLGIRLLQLGLRVFKGEQLSLGQQDEAFTDEVVAEEAPR